MRRRMQEGQALAGPPGPAGGYLALPGAGQPDAAVAVNWAEQLPWLRALKHLQLPLDAFNLGLSSDGCLAGRQLLREVHGWELRRCCLLVLVRRLEVVAGELQAQLADPSGCAWASLGFGGRCCEGSVLCLVGALVVQGMVFVPPSAVAQVFPPSQGSSAEAQELRAAARAVERAARRDEYVQ
ncbi:unnamed protein product [Effrenium voratum]|uniref:Uncharacterized protein n=1 Tax=Effrenium voratum TaxID=2562239 RepID=A0AA36HK16_9DINO|nr:unnamed protein product [Effrenium voratum]CAJ1370236.1 unnamed protein product [Effrenium voratum]